MVKKNNIPDHSPRATAGNMARGTIRMFLAELLFLPTGLVTAIFLARQLGPVNYGLFSLLALLVAWVEGNTNSVFANVSVKLVGEEKDWRSVSTVIVRLYLVLGLSVSILFYLLAEPLSNILNEPSLVFYIKLFSVDILLTSLCCANHNILVGRGFFRETAWIKTCHLIARLVLIILFVELGFSLTGAVIGLIGATVVEIFISSYFAKPSLFTKGHISGQRLFDIGTPLFFSQLAMNMIGLHFFMLKFLGASAEQLGFFGAAINLAIPPTLFAAALSTTLYSTVNRMVSEGEIKKAKRMVFMSIRSVYFLFPFAFMSAGLSHEIVGIIYGEKFLPAAPVLSFLIFIPVVFLMINIARTVLIVNEKHSHTMGLALPALIAAILGHLLFTRTAGGVGAAVVTLAAGSIGALIAVVMMYKIWQVKIPVKTVFSSIMCSVIAYSAAFFLPVSGLWVFMKIIVISLIIIVTLYLAGEFKSEEISFFRVLISKDRQKP